MIRQGMAAFRPAGKRLLFLDSRRYRLIQIISDSLILRGRRTRGVQRFSAVRFAAGGAFGIVVAIRSEIVTDSTVRSLREILRL